jgi:hypothetical protein
MIRQAAAESLRLVSVFSEEFVREILALGMPAVDFVGRCLDLSGRVGESGPSCMLQRATLKIGEFVLVQ